MAQEYTVKQWKPWENEEGLVRDQHGNYKGSVIFEEDASEPIDATFKTQPNPGDKKFGVVADYQTKAGKTRKGFKSAPRPLDGQPAFTSGGVNSPKKEWQPRDDDTIRAQWAIGQATQLLSTKYGKEVLTAERADQDFQLIEDIAKRCYAMVDRVKGSSESTSPKAETSDYIDSDPEFSSMLEAGLRADNIDLADIPF